MSEASLQDRRILVVEDEYFIADAMQRELEEVGALVIGPAASVAEAMALLHSGPLDAAILDVNLDGDDIFPLAQMLADRGIPFLFATGYSASDLPSAWRHVPRYEKPVDAVQVARALLGNDAI